MDLDTTCSGRARTWIETEINSNPSVDEVDRNQEEEGNDQSVSWFFLFKTSIKFVLSFRKDKG